MWETPTVYFPSSVFVKFGFTEGMQHSTQVSNCPTGQRQTRKLWLTHRRKLRGTMLCIGPTQEAQLFTLREFLKANAGITRPYYIYTWKKRYFGAYPIGVGDGVTTAFTLPMSELALVATYDDTVLLTGGAAGTVATAGAWTARNTPADLSWQSVAYGNGVFVAVAASGTGNRVMTSPDGVTWTSRSSAADNNWSSVTFGAGLFVAVAITGTGNRVMTSPDGITWTSRTSAGDHSWYSVTYAAGLFVAVSIDDTGGGAAGKRVMTSPDGITWTLRTAAASNQWSAVTYGNGLFVAVAFSGSSNRIMTSPDGITWTIQSSDNRNWTAIAYGNGVFVAVEQSGTNSRVMTSPDGVTWTKYAAAADSDWRAIAFGNGVFVATSSSKAMSSTDGATWTLGTGVPGGFVWGGVVYGRDKFVAVSQSGTTTLAITSVNAGGGQAIIQFSSAPASGDPLTADFNARERIAVASVTDSDDVQFDWTAAEPPVEIALDVMEVF